jgi:hypothetical protein
MPTFGSNSGSTQNVDIFPVDPSQIPALEQRQRNRNRIKVQREAGHIFAASKEKQVYIFNVSPWSHNQPTGSMGTFYIPALAEKDVLSTELLVAGPLIIPGLPSETIPIDDGRTGRRDYHTPMEGRPDAEDSGLHFAKEVCGAGGIGAQQESNLLMQGVFISKKRGYNRVPAIQNSRAWIREVVTHYGLNLGDFADYQVEEVAEKVHDQAGTVYKQFAASPFFAEWKEMVRAAQQEFRGKCERLCLTGNMAHSSRTFHNVNDPVLFKAAHFLGKTVVECPWLTNSGDSARNTACPECRSIIQNDAMICPTCTAQLVSDATLENARKLRREGKA